jgi:sec-independent protein translocase protein TatA
MNFPVFTLAFIDGLGGPEMLLIFVIILMLFGKDKLPELARGIGKSMKELKKATTNVEEEFKRALQEDEYRQNQTNSTPAITSAQPVAALSAGTSPETTAEDTIPASPVATDAPVPPVASEPVAAADVSAPLNTDVSSAPTVSPTPAPAPAPRKPAAPHRGRADV